MEEIKRNMVPAVLTILVGIGLLFGILSTACPVHGAEKGEINALVQYAYLTQPAQTDARGNDSWSLGVDGLPLKDTGSFVGVYFTVFGVAKPEVVLECRRTTEFPIIGVAVIETLSFYDKNVDGVPEEIIYSRHTVRIGDGMIIKIFPPELILWSLSLCQVFDEGIEKLMGACFEET